MDARNALAWQAIAINNSSPPARAKQAMAVLSVALRFAGSAQSTLEDTCGIGMSDRVLSCHRLGRLSLETRRQWPAHRVRSGRRWHGKRSGVTWLWRLARLLSPCFLQGEVGTLGWHWSADTYYNAKLQCWGWQRGTQRSSVRNSDNRLMRGIPLMVYERASGMRDINH